MKRIIQANIDRFRQLLETESDPTKRVMLHRLLAEQESELKNATDTPSAAGKAF